MARAEETKTHLENLAIIPNSAHGDAATDNVFAIYAVDADPMSPGTAKFAITGNGDTTITAGTAEIILENGETIKNQTNSTIEFGAAVLKHAYDSAAYWTATQDDGGAVTFDSVSDGTPGFYFSDVVNLVRDDTVDGIVSILTLTHSSSDNNATVGDGVGLSFRLENATGTSTVEQWASIYTISTTITNGSEDGDVVINLMAGGTVVPALTLDSSDQSITIGANSTDADGFHQLRLYPVTASKGSLLISAVANTGDTVLTITNAAQAGAYTYTIPSAGASCEFVMGAGAQTIAGAKSFTDIMSITQATGAQLTIKNDAAAYFTITQANAGGVTFDCTSDGTANFAFSDAVAITSATAAQLTLLFDANAYMTITQADAAGVTFNCTSDGTAAFTFSDPVTCSSTLGVTGITTLGNVAHAGLLLGSGTSGTPFDVGASGGKAMSFYIKSASVTAGHTLEGLYCNVDFGNGTGATAAPTGEAGRFRASLKGSPNNVYGAHNTVEWISAGATVSGGASGTYSNLVFLDSSAGGGTLCGANVELTSGGTSTDLTGATASILRLTISGTVTANKFTVPAINLMLPSNLVGNDLVFDDTASANTVGGKLRIMVNGVTYWIMCADAAD